MPRRHLQEVGPPRARSTLERMMVHLPRLYQMIRTAQQRSERIYEAVIGVVTANQDPEKLGRVKVKFPTLPRNGPEETSWWAVIAAQGAGKDRGWWFLPEVDDEVLVMFEHGEISRPVVIGALWNGEDLPPEKNGGKNERRIIHSRQGSRIVMDDDKGTVTIEDGGKIGKIVISKENKISIEAMSGDVCIQSPKGEMSIVANEITMQASENGHVQADGALAIGASSAATFASKSILATSKTIDFNNGARMASEASDACEDVPDPIKPKGGGSGGDA
jgi:uncharacterized protein involved in type VI secretion and phage assembly